MNLTRSLLGLAVLAAALSFTSCTSTGGGVPAIALGETPIHAHRFGLVNPIGSFGSFGGHGGGYGNNYAPYPMPTERFGDYFVPDNDPSLVGNGWDRYDTVYPRTPQPIRQPASEPSGYTASK